MTIHARHYATGLPIRLELADEVITSVTPSDRYTREADLPYVAPGFFDLQINGYGGVWFCDPDLTVDAVLQVLAGYLPHGVTRLFPTLITSSREALCHGLATIRAACEREPWAAQMVAGCHVEGPFISPEDGPRGAHPLTQVRPCDWSEFEAWQVASGGRVRLVTLAAEAVGAVPFIAQASRAGVTIALGHSAANSEQITAAVRAGARLSTHLGNGAPPMLPRHPNLLWDQLGDDRLAASLITDGHHVPPGFLRTAIRAKGATECIITCDASGLAGCPPGIYPTQGQSFEVLANGKIVVAGQRTLLAGSAQTTETCVARCIAMTGITLGTACDMAGDHPARILRIPRIRLMTGCRADLVLFQHRPGDDPQLEIVQTWLAGSQVAGNSTGATQPNEVLARRAISK